MRLSNLIARIENVTLNAAAKAKPAATNVVRAVKGFVEDTREHMYDIEVHARARRILRDAQLNADALRVIHRKMDSV